jgi:hypothetical protein
MKKFVLMLAIAAGSVFAVGCDGKGSSAAKDMKDAAKDGMKDAKDGVKDMKDKAGETAKDAMDKGKEMLEKAQKEITDKFDLKAIEGAIGKLPAEKMDAAKKQWDSFNTMLKEFKAAPMEKMGEWKDKLVKAYDELKKMAGL